MTSNRKATVEPNGPFHVDVSQVCGRSWIQYTLRFREVRYEILRTLRFVLEIVGVSNEPGLNFSRDTLGTSIGGRPEHDPERFVILECLNVGSIDNIVIG